MLVSSRVVGILADCASTRGLNVVFRRCWRWWYTGFNSSSRMISPSHMISAGRVGLVDSLWSTQANLVFSQDRIDGFGDVPLLLNGLFGFLP